MIRLKIITSVLCALDHPPGIALMLPNVTRHPILSGDLPAPCVGADVEAVGPVLRHLVPRQEALLAPGALDGGAALLMTVLNVLL